MTWLATFWDQSMSESGFLCVGSAIQNGGDQTRIFTPEIIKDWTLVTENRSVFDQPRGVGLWAWKPLIVDAVMKQASDGDILIYSDAGVEFINNVNHIIDRMDQDIFLFGNNWEHAHWCKADILEEIRPLSTGNPNLPWRNASYTFGKQVQASVIFFRVSDYSRRFVAEWLKWCLFEGGRLIDDSPSRIRNHPEFQENRHDQAILTTMAYRDGLTLHWWPAEYNDRSRVYEKLPCYQGDDYPAIFHHHRRRNHEWSEAA